LNGYDEFVKCSRELAREEDYT